MSKENILGIDEETIEKSKNIHPTLELGKLDVGDMVFVTVLDKEPTEVEHEDTFNKGQMIKTKVLTVLTERVIRADGTDIPMGEKNALWLSSKVLRIGLSTAMEENNNELEGLKVSIKVGMATYKQGENRAYSVSRID